jgi:hypothetical protein
MNVVPTVAQTRRPSLRSPLAGVWGAVLPVLPAGLITLVLGAVFIARSGFSYQGRTYFSLFDDSMISMTYARNLAEGHGLVWNAGGDPVEGITNLLWTLWMALIHLAGASDATSSLMVMVTGVVLLVANLFVVHAIARRIAPEAPVVAQIAVVLTALLYPLLFWTLRGMEVGLLTLLVSLGVLLALRVVAVSRPRDVAALAAVLAAGLLTRDDSLTWGLVIVAFVAWRSRRAAVLLGLALGATLVAKTGFRLAYYGDALPNTYELKLGGSPLGERLRRGVVALGNVGLIELYAPVALAAVAFIRRPKQWPALAMLAALVVVQCAYSVYVGGDVWELFEFTNRYITPVFPCLLILAAYGLHELVTAGGRGARAAIAVAAFFALVALLNVAAAESSRAQDELIRLSVTSGRHAEIWVAIGLAIAAGAGAWALRRGRLPSRVGLVAGAGLLAIAISGQQLVAWGEHNADYLREDADMSRYGLLLGEETPPESRLLVAWAGGIPYFAHREGVDLLGKSDRVIATGPRQPVPFNPGHDKWNYSYSVGELRPEVITQLWLAQGQLREAQRALRGWGYTEVGQLASSHNGSVTLYVTRAISSQQVAELRRRLPGVIPGSRLVRAADR